MGQQLSLKKLRLGNRAASGGESDNNAAVAVKGKECTSEAAKLAPIASVVLCCSFF